MVFGFADVSMAPSTNYFQLWRHQDTSNHSRRNGTFLENNMSDIFRILELPNVENVEKAGQKNPNIRVIFLEILNTRSISSRKRELIILGILNMGSISSTKHWKCGDCN